MGWKLASDGSEDELRRSEFGPKEAFKQLPFEKALIPTHADSGSARNSLSKKCSILPLKPHTR